ncbi:hypothetical protein [Streptomyces sp. NPDC049915]|uniref:hypothetical protein n=1 Tax=Streptomyces sp. NPDC049915 TaxID=3155510 RepID=UPI003446A989
MDEDDCCFLLLSMRELSALGLSVRTARTKTEVTRILQAYELSEEDFEKGFPYLKKVVRDLPADEGDPTTP